MKWAEKQEKVRPKEMCFFLTSPFIELIGCEVSAVDCLNFVIPKSRV